MSRNLFGPYSTHILNISPDAAKSRLPVRTRLGLWLPLLLLAFGLALYFGAATALVIERTVGGIVEHRR